MAKTAIRIIIFFWVVILIGFWPTYFTRLSAASPQAHVHGLMVFGWYALMLLQAVLIQRRSNDLHRALGKISYFHAPLLAVASLVLVDQLLQRGDSPPIDYHLRLLAIILPTVAAFLLLYVQAIRHRRTAQTHYRYMIATGIVWLMPAWSRLLGAFVQPLVLPLSDPPTLDQLTLPDHAGLIIMQLFTLALLLSDWREGRDTRPYAYCLLLLVLIQLLFTVLPEQAWWRAFGEAYMALPLA